MFHGRFNLNGTRLNEVQRGICGICGQPVGRQSRSVDHVVPISKGGYSGLGNLVMAHKSCNGKKSGRWPTGCECIFLMGVNLALGVPDKPLAGLNT